MAAPPSAAVPGVDPAASACAPQLDSSTITGLVVRHAVDGIIDHAAAVLYDHYLASKETEFAVSRAMGELALLVDWQLPTTDAAEHRPAASSLPGYMASVTGAVEGAVRGAWTAEPEPEPPVIDSWARSAIPLRLPARKKADGEGGEAAGRPGDVSGGGTSVGGSSAQRRLLARQASVRSGSGVAGGARLGPAGVPGGLAPIAEGKASETSSRVGGGSTLAGDRQQQQRSVMGGDAGDALSTGRGSSLTHTTGLAKTGGAGGRRRDGEPAAGASVAGDAAADRGGKKGETEADKARRVASMVRGKPYTLDERGNVVVVNAVPGDKLPPTVLQVGITVDGGAGDAAAAGAAGVAADAPAAADANASPQRLPPASSPGGSESFASLRSSPSVADAGAAAAAAATAGGRASKASKSDPRFFKETVSAQPSLVDTVPAHAVSPGVVISEDGRAVTGPERPSDERRVSRRTFQSRTVLLAPSAASAPRAPAGSARESPSLFLSGGLSGSSSPVDRAPPAAGGVGGAVQTSRPPPGDAVDVEFSLASIPDVVQPVSQMLPAIRSAHAQVQRAAAAAAEASVRARVPLAAPRSAATSPQRSPTRSEQFVTSAFMRSQAGHAGSEEYGGVPSAHSPPREVPVVATPHLLASAVGNVARRPRDRATVTTATLPVRHMPAPLYPAVSHFDGLGAAAAAALEDTDAMLGMPASPSGSRSQRSPQPVKTPTFTGGAASRTGGFGLDRDARPAAAAAAATMRSMTSTASFAGRKGSSPGGGGRVIVTAKARARAQPLAQQFGAAGVVGGALPSI